MAVLSVAELVDMALNLSKDVTTRYASQRSPWIRDELVKWGSTGMFGAWGAPVDLQSEYYEHPWNIVLVEWLHQNNKNDRLRKSIDSEILRQFVFDASQLLYQSNQKMEIADPIGWDVVRSKINGAATSFVTTISLFRDEKKIPDVNSHAFVIGSRAFWIASLKASDKLVLHARLQFIALNWSPPKVKTWMFTPHTLWTPESVLDHLKDYFHGICSSDCMDNSNLENSAYRSYVRSKGDSNSEVVLNLRHPLIA